MQNPAPSHLSTKGLSDQEAARALRSVFGRYATGVTVVAVDTPDGPVGMTANSFTSVSLDPPLVLWCPARASHRFPLFEAADRFAIHILASDQKDLAQHFAREGGGFDRFGATRCDHGLPVLPGCIGRIACRTHDIMPGGDHAIILGEVLGATATEGEGLIFASGRYINAE